MIGLFNQNLPEIARELRVYCPFDEAQSARRYDRIGNTHFDPSYSYADLASGKSGNAFKSLNIGGRLLQGVNGAVFPHQNAITHIFNVELDYTVCFWLYNSLSNQSTYPMQLGDSTIYLGSTSGWGISMALGNSTPSFAYNSACSVAVSSANTWSLWCYRHDAVAKTRKLKIIVNNVGYESSTTYTGAAMTNTGLFRNGIDSVRFGWRGAGAGVTNNFEGYWEEFAVWQRVLTDSELDFLYNSGNGRTIYSNTQIF